MTSDQPPIGVFVDWGLSLTEPLISLRARNRAASEIASLHVHHRAQARLFWAGVCSDIVRTLPVRDPWRQLSARYGARTVGPNPPPVNGALDPDGRPFGTWHDAADLTPLVYATPSDDPALAALVDDDLTPAAAAILAAAAGGWRVCLDMITTVEETPSPVTAELAGVTDLATRESYRRGESLHRAREACEQAIRWAVHRRRAYIGPADAWPAESVFRWGWRACRAMEGKGWPDDEIETAIAEERVTAPAPVDMDPFDDDDLF